MHPAQPVGAVASVAVEHENVHPAEPRVLLPQGSARRAQRRLSVAAAARGPQPEEGRHRRAGRRRGPVPR
eukprot:scaffold2731_cov128-Isochrysis_galbana.AAC.1